MDLSLPASTHSSRRLNPQEYASPTKQVTNCSKLQFLATNINLLAAEVESIKKLIQSILDKGYTEDPFLAETTGNLQ
ncbi:hypothetical protein TNCV_5082741 [Trichonephila clavipes]|nr:hypothetical protein TNCV_5082741 [Trichonephila clavipes]